MKDKANAFSPAVLAAVEALDGPATLTISANAGPWEVILMPDGRESKKDAWTVRSLDGGTEAARAEDFETAALIASVLPLESRPAAYDMADGDNGPEIRMTFVGGGHQSIARFAGYRPDIDHAMEAAHLIATSPRSLALVMSAASTDTLTRAGEILVEILDRRAKNQRDISQRRLP